MQPKIVVIITGNQMLDEQDVPTYDNGRTAFYWDDDDSPIGTRVWCLFEHELTPDEATKAMTDRLSETF